MSEHEAQPTGYRRFLLTYRHKQGTVHTVEVSLPVYGTQEPMSYLEGQAWKAADRLVESIHPVRLHELTRVRIARMEDCDEANA